MTDMVNSPGFAPRSGGDLEAAVQQRRRQRVRRERIGAVAYPLGMMVAALALWEIAARRYQFRPICCRRRAPSSSRWTQTRRC